MYINKNAYNKKMNDEQDSKRLKISYDLNDFIDYCDNNDLERIKLFIDNIHQPAELQFTDVVSYRYIHNNNQY
jgi:hypothetical protein